uniref:Uncharacterized protein n=1 Tax=Esox lucius TaxID=8010 RepID=A0AAY5KIH0_ESOLU
MGRICATSDNDPKHTGKRRVTEGPVQSPDLNQNQTTLLKCSKSTLHAKKKTLYMKLLKQHCKEEWAKIPPSRYDRLTDSYKKRLH